MPCNVFTSSFSFSMDIDFTRTNISKMPCNMFTSTFSFSMDIDSFMKRNSSFTYILEIAAFT